MQIEMYANYGVLGARGVCLGRARGEIYDELVIEVPDELIVGESWLGDPLTELTWGSMRVTATIYELIYPDKDGNPVLDRGNLGKTKLKVVSRK